MAVKVFKPQAYSAAQLDQAKRLFMSFETTVGIARQTGIPRSSLRYYIKESWKEEREADAQELITRIVGGRAAQLEELSVITLDTITFSMREVREALMSGKRAARSADMLNYAKTLEILDKLAFADKRNNPDSNKTMMEGVDTINMEQIMELDPFALPAPKEDKEKKK